MDRVLLIIGWLIVAASGSAYADFVRMPANRGGTDWLKVGLWAYPMAVDWDGDGRLDIVVTTPCVPYEGTYLFRNQGNGLFAKSVKLSDHSSQNVVMSRTDGRNVVLSPTGAIWDFNGDMAKKLWRPLDGVPENPHPHKVRGNVRRFVDFDGDGRDDVIIGVGCWRDYGWADAYDECGVWTNKPIESAIYWCRNTSGKGPDARYAAPVEVRLADGSPFETYGNPSPMLEDWDGDGDLDILCGSFIDSFHYFENIGTRGEPLYVARGKVLATDGKPLAVDLEMAKPTAVDWDGDGRPDILCGDEDGRVCWMRNTGRMERGAPIFEPPQYFRQESDDLHFGALVTPWVIDWDGDGDEDLICGNSAGRLAFIENLSGRGVASPKWAEPRLLKSEGREIRILAGENGSIQGPAEAKWGYTVPCAADWDGDGFPDIVVNSIFGDVVWYRNTGQNGALDMERVRPVEVEWGDDGQPELAWGWRKPDGKALLTQWRTTPVVIDWNRDGLPDLIMLDHEGYLSFFERFRDDAGALRLKAPRRIFAEASGAPLRLNARVVGGRRKICFCDWDGDGRLDLIANGVNAEFRRNLGETGGVTRFAPAVALGARRLAGHTTAPAPCDFDGDGMPDLVLGAEDGFIYFLQNETAPRSFAPVEMRRLESGNAGTRDLKGGLWAHPLPGDWNGDGIPDIAVGYPDTIWRGIFLFEGTRSGVFRQPRRVASGTMALNATLSVVDSIPVLGNSQGFYWDFIRNGFERKACFTPNPSHRPKVRENEYGGARSMTVQLADLDGDGCSDIVEWSRGGVWWRRNMSGCNAVDAVFGAEESLLGTDGKPLSGCAFPVFADFDGDGDLDILSVSGVDRLSYYENVGSRTKPVFASARAICDGSGAPVEFFLCLPRAVALDWDGDGLIDIICGEEDGRVSFLRNAGRAGGGGVPVFDQPVYFRQEADGLNCGVLATPSACDWDGDGDIDIICGNSAGELRFIENLSGPGVAKPVWAEPVALSCRGSGGIPSNHAANDPIRIVAGKTGSLQGPGEAKWGYTVPCVCDWDGDGLPDVLVNTVWGYVYWHRNEGTRQSPALGPAMPIEVEWNGAQPNLPFEWHNKPNGKELMTQWRTTPCAVDLNADGLVDLVMMDSEGYLAFFERGKRADGTWFLKHPVRALLDERDGQPLMFAVRTNGRPYGPGGTPRGRSGRRKLCFVDWDGDGRLDLIANEKVSEGGFAVELWRQTESRDDKWVFRNEGPLSATRLEGHSCAPTPVDFDGDGTPELVVGAEDGFLYFLPNMCQSEEVPGAGRLTRQTRRGDD